MKLYELRDLGSVVTGSTPPTYNDSNYGGAIPFVTPAELVGSSPVTAAPRSLSDAGAQFARILPTGAVMVCCIGSVGKVGIAGTSLATNQQINSINFDTSKVLPNYGFYACRQLGPQLAKYSSSTTVPIVSKSKFARLTIPVPTLGEQRRIAAILDKADELRAKRRKALALLDILTDSIFEDVFQAIDSFEKLAEMVDFRYGTSNKSQDHGAPTLRIPNIVSGSVDTTEIKTVPVTSIELDRLRLKDGDLLFVRSNGNPENVGRCAVFDRLTLKTRSYDASNFIYASYLIRGRRKRSSVSPLFLQAFLSSTTGRRSLIDGAKTSAGQFNINTKALGEIMVPLAPVALQRTFESRISAAGRLKEHQRAQLTELDSLFASLQHRAFKGEL